MASAFLSVLGLPLFLILVVSTNGVDAKTRQKREWVVPAQKLTENVDYTGKTFVARVRSDKNDKVDLDYFLNGPGATEEPFNLFIVDKRNGLIRVTGILDREKIPMYTMSAVVKYKNGSIAEDNIAMRIEVIDQNDNPPVFDVLQPGNVSEGSPPGTFVTQVRATDKDDPATLHTVISYSIIKQEPEDTGFMFNINSSSGQICVWKPDIDRERISSYVLTVKATDMNGHPGGLTGTGTVTVKVLDINDNMPTLEKDQYEAGVNENTANVEVLRIKALDKDLEQTDNWLADFEIVSGNEDGTFSIETDPKTNDGVLILRKEVDFEQVPNMQLGVVVRNKAPFQNSVWSAGSDPSSRPGSGGTSGSGSLKQYPIKVNIRNLPDPPRFVPKVKAASIPKDSTKINLPHVIATYPVIDGDSGTVAKNIWYAKDYDPEQLLSINETTAEVKLNKVPDQKSKYVKDGTYYAKVIGVMKDFPFKTATGTIAIEVQDSNENCPHITSSHQVLCSDVQAVTVTAVNENDDPNAAPFGFTLVAQNPSDQWELESFNDTAAVLKPTRKLESGSSMITLVIKDRQGLACSDNQVLNLDVCTCTEDSVCEGRALSPSFKSFGSSAIGIMILAIFLLLLAPFLLLFCGTSNGHGSEKVDLSYLNEPTMITYHTEGIGEDMDLLKLPVMPSEEIRIEENPNPKFPFKKRNIFENVIHRVSPINRSVTDYPINKEKDNKGTIRISEGYGGGELIGKYRTSSMGFLKNYYSQKARFISEDNNENDIIMNYKRECGSSLAGSIASLSFVDMDDNLDFLNDLDPKFKTLAEVCTNGETGFEEYRPLEEGIAEHGVEPNHKICGEGTETVKAQQLNIASSSLASPAINISVTAGTQELNTAGSNTISSAEEIPKITSAFPNMQAREDTIDFNQMCLIQQPVYYTTTPVLQSTQYVVDPQVNNTILVSGWPPVTNMQAMCVVNGAPRSDIMILGERVLVGPSAQNAPFAEHPGTLRMNENVLLVERKGMSGPMVQEATAGTNRGLVQMGNVPKSQNITLSRKVQLEDPTYFQEGSRGTSPAPQDGFTE
ncbi:desmoglein-4-like [Brienomyrus brachyistius]|uniref:desmoglein-4-like n=1 Tax=Brienomyrus brachyistius TaxID=42636 RepID=UPI0020B2BDAF|nr:desmoglein-4-like [Brienomyrus brachyistius]